MKKFSCIPIIFQISSLVTLGFGASSAPAAEALFNGGFEIAAGPQGWNLTQTITGMPGAAVSAVEHLDQAAYPAPEEGKLGLLVRGYAGDIGNYEDQNKAVNVTLTQTTPSLGTAAGNKVFTLVGHSYYQLNYSGNVNTLYAQSPSGAIPSPTSTQFKVEFLDTLDAVVATHTLPLPKNRIDDVLPGAYQTHTLVTPASPVSTRKVRVTAEATNMVQNCGGPEGAECGGAGGQDVFFDNFSLTLQGSPVERLSNANLDAIGAPTGWAIEKTAQDNIQFSTANYAINTGTQGVWWRAFAGGDAKVLQTAPATAGTDYQLTAFAKMQPGYSGLDPFSPTQTFLTMEFLDGANNLIGSPVSINPATAYTWPANVPDPTPDEVNQGVWQQVGLPVATAPVGTMNVRVSAGATAMQNSGLPIPQSFMFDDFSLMTIGGPGLDGDHNGDGAVDAADYVTWRKSPGTFGGDPAGYQTWRENFGEPGAGAGGSNGAVPEPAAGCMLFVGLASLVLGSQRRHV